MSEMGAKGRQRWAASGVRRTSVCVTARGVRVMRPLTGVIIGGAFGKIVSSLVTDVLTPPIGFLTGGVKFEDLKHEFPKMTVGGIELAPPTINYGKFLQASFDFLIVALCVFLLVKAMNKIMPKPAAAPAAPAGPSEVDLLKDILAALKK